MTDEQVRDRIDAYCTRYGVKELNDEGFPAFPAGLRETKQHREWITLYKLFGRSRRRASLPDDEPKGPTTKASACRICLQPVRPSGTIHRRCAEVVDLIRDLGPSALDRIRAEAFPGNTRAAARPGSVPKRKS
jgi:hypothetical protein